MRRAISGCSSGMVSRCAGQRGRALPGPSLDEKGYLRRGREHPDGTGINQPTKEHVMANFLSSDHWVHFQDLAGRQVYVLSGTCILDPPLQGPSDGSRWQRGQTSSAFPSATSRPMRAWWSSNGRHGCRRVDPERRDREQRRLGGRRLRPRTRLRRGHCGDHAQLNFAVGDSDGYMMRIAYSVTVVGHFAPFTIIQ